MTRKNDYYYARELVVPVLTPREMGDGGVRHQVRGSLHAQICVEHDEDPPCLFSIDHDHTRKRGRARRRTSDQVIKAADGKIAACSYRAG